MYVCNIPNDYYYDVDDDDANRPLVVNSTMRMFKVGHHCHCMLYQFSKKQVLFIRSSLSLSVCGGGGGKEMAERGGRADDVMGLNDDDGGGGVCVW